MGMLNSQHSSVGLVGLVPTECLLSKTSHDRTHFRKGDGWHWNNFLAENRETHSFQRSEGLFIARLLTLHSEIVTSWAQGLHGLQD